MKYPRSARTRDAAPAGANAAGPAVTPSPPLLENLRFPGCHPLPLPRDRFEGFDERLEYWDARTETAWVAETLGGAHECTSRRRLHLIFRIGMARGTPIVALGTIGLVERDVSGAPVRAMQPDETLYLHPDRTVIPAGSLVIGEHDLPDMVLEVDHTTDIRPGKLPVYEAWGVPELWAVVPRGAKRRRRPGVTIRRMIGGRYHSSPASVALPGWTADEIHAALTEPRPSARTDRVLERVGRVLGEREGTRPNDEPLIRSLNAKDRAEGRAEGVVASVRGVFRARGISAGGSLRRRVAGGGDGRGRRLHRRGGLLAPSRSSAPVTPAPSWRLDKASTVPHTVDHVPEFRAIGKAKRGAEMACSSRGRSRCSLARGRAHGLGHGARCRRWCSGG